MTAALETFHFLRPLWLLAIAPAGLMISTLLLQQVRAVQWQKHIAPELLPALLDGEAQKSRHGLLGMLALLWVLCCIALAGPVWERQPTPVVQNTDALVIAWDLSPSMLARDVTPSRLERSRLKIIDLLNSRADGQTALIAYSAEAYTVTPLTDDIQTIINLLPALGPTTLPSVGSNPEMAFEQSNELLNQAGIPNGHIVMLTDEITPDALGNMHSMVSDSKHRLTLWGIGSSGGAPIPLPRGGFAKDGTGNMVLASLNEKALRDFATETNSYYVPVVTDNSDISALETLLGADKSRNQASNSNENTERMFDQWLERGHWLIWLCLPLVALGFRRGWLLCWVLAIPLVQLPQTAEASIFKTPDQQGFTEYEAGNFDQAAENFKNPLWQGSAHYRAGDYEAAARAFSSIDTAEANYNQGNAELLQGNLDGAIAAYENALKKNPELSGAQKNLAFAEELKKQQQEQENQQQGQGDNSDQQDSEQLNSEQQESDQEKSEQQQRSDQQNGQQKDQPQSDQESDQESDQDQDSQQAQGSEDQSQQNAQAGDEGSSSSSDSTAMQNDDAASSQGSEGNNSSGASQIGQNQSEGSASSADSLAQYLAEQGTEEPMSEEEQMIEQVLRKVPDDPAGLLRNKFQYQYKQRQQEVQRGFSQTQDAERRW